MDSANRQVSNPGQAMFIDLPPPPLSVARPERSLVGVPVVAHLLDGGTVAGGLVRLDSADGFIALRLPTQS